MKRLLLINEDLQCNDLFKLPEERVLYKKNKTLVKDGKLINKKFTEQLDEHNIKWKLLMEEWEVFNQDRIQVCMGPDNQMLKPIHVISYPKPDGIKALFQQDKMTTVSVSNEEITITKYYLKEYELKYNIILKSPFKGWDSDIIPEEFRPVVKIIESNLNNIRMSNNYDILLYGINE